ncbi:MAG: biosynthetic-type acetolactate synthase large subunit [Clostridia bacterium]|jgi:acetolactate synthase-1/2/3 large subunit|nr:biosynthetic-type acetolactate synthase large subunit [Clostridia bacterium]MDD4145507.1 biosynthetic-type acetolactate synthase large subunit [Clostridia bacterium]MDD4665004.1 biosynthetic-type acetolactate synthase large subunit [Clostridia bacterium]
MNGAEYIVRFLEKKGVDLVFGYPGGAVLFLYDVLGRSSIQHILTRHEQGAIHAADGYARATGKTGVCLATSGPGATNLVTGIANANLDSVPILAITGQVGVESIGRDSFQEADIVGITMPITKHNYLVKELDNLPEALEEAWQVAREGRPGPVLMDIPKNVFTGTADFSEVVLSTRKHKIPFKNGLARQLGRITEVLKKAQKPLLFAGGGVVSAGAWEELEDFTKYTGIPVVTSLMGKGVIPEEEGGSLGMIGMHGKPAANLALSQCDVLLALGTRFSDRVTGNPQHFLADTCIIHVDIDPAELFKNVRVEFPVVSDAKKFLQMLLQVLREEKVSFALEPWLDQIKAWAKEYPLTFSQNSLLKPQAVMREVARQAVNQPIVVTDVGQHQMFVAQHYPVQGRRNFITSGGLGTMGFGLPAAMGAALGRPGETVILFTGDGGFQMTVQELAVMAEYQLPVKIFLINNSCLGMVRQWQELFFNGHYAHSLFTGGPDFIKLAEAYGVKAWQIRKPEETKEIVSKALQHTGPVVVECLVDAGENVLPMVPPGGKPSEMLGRWHGEAHISRLS